MRIARFFREGQVSYGHGRPGPVGGARSVRL